MPEYAEAAQPSKSFSMLRSRDKTSVDQFLAQRIADLKEEESLVAEFTPIPKAGDRLEDIRTVFHTLLERYYPDSDIQNTDKERAGRFRPRDASESDAMKQKKIRNQVIEEAREYGIKAAKWVIRCKVPDVYRYWEAMVREVMQGRLGIRAEVYGGQRRGLKDFKPRRIYIWTEDFDD